MEEGLFPHSRSLDERQGVKRSAASATSASRGRKRAPPVRGAAAQRVRSNRRPRRRSPLPRRNPRGGFWTSARPPPPRRPDRRRATGTWTTGTGSFSERKSSQSPGAGPADHAFAPGARVRHRHLRRGPSGQEPGAGQPPFPHHRVPPRGAQGDRRALSSRGCDCGCHRRRASIKAG